MTDSITMGQTRNKASRISPGLRGARFKWSGNSALGILLLLFVLSPWCRAASAPATLIPALGWDVKTQGGFPVSLASDAGGNIWVGTEGNGLWKYDPAKKTWSQFTTKDGLGDDCVYALAFDRQNRLWAGHLNHGVSVYNGDKWRNYGLIDGPIGDRVFAIAVSPKDGDVWIATDMGLARYSEKRQDWDYYTRASGLPSDQIQCLTFDDKGQLYAGTQCNGIAIAGPDDNYTKWRNVTAPPSAPGAPVGEGLASNFINAINLLRLGEHPSLVMALTQFGTAITPDGNHWWFTRGRDWQDHTPGPYKNNGGSVGGAIPAEDSGFALAPAAGAQPVEDWTTALGSEGWRHWVGYRKLGVESYEVNEDGQQKFEVQANVPKGSVLIRAILALPNQPVIVAAYDYVDGGLLTLASAPPYKPSTPPAPQPLHPPLPAPVPLPTLDDVKALTARLGKLTLQLVPGEAYYLADDWRTQGDWIGRYGSGYVKLCGIAQDGDRDYSLQPGYKVSVQAGLYHEPPGEASWGRSDDSSDDLRSLYDPMLGHRRDGADDDVGWGTDIYFTSKANDGPNLWVKAKVPEGVHCLSLYFVNAAHVKFANIDAPVVNAAPKYRDYDVQIFSGQNADGKMQTDKPLARTRVTDFWGGVYKQFIVCGPADYMVRIGRNRSFVTQLQAVFLDRVTGDMPENPGQLPGFDLASYEMPEEPDDENPTPLAAAAATLWRQLDNALALRGAVPLQMPLRIWCYRAAIAGQAPAALLERWRWQIGIWTPDDRKKFDNGVKAAHDAIK